METKLVPSIKAKVLEESCSITEILIRNRSTKYLILKYQPRKINLATPSIAVNYKYIQNIIN